MILQKEPFFTICDFSKSLLSGIRKAFPNTQIGHDYFHTAKLLNEGLLKEMRRLKKHAYTYPIREFHLAREASQKAMKSKNFLSLQFKNSFLQGAYGFYHNLHNLVSSSSVNHFIQNWNDLKGLQATTNWKPGLQIIQDVEDSLPLCGFTQKNFLKYWENTCNVWRRIVRHERNTFEEKQKGYSKACYRVLMNPSNMSQRDKQKLRESLKKFPFLRDIRTGVRKFHNQFKTKNTNWRSLAFLQKLVNEKSHRGLKSAVATLIEAESRIFAYRDVLAKHPHLKKGKSIRTNREELNRKIGLVARNQYGLRSTSGACVRLAGILNCTVITSEALWKKEKKEL